jgi:hypothetical protein
MAPIASGMRDAPLCSSARSLAWDREATKSPARPEHSEIWARCVSLTIRIGLRMWSRRPAGPRVLASTRRWPGSAAFSGARRRYFHDGIGTPVSAGFSLFGGNSCLIVMEKINNARCRHPSRVSRQYIQLFANAITILPDFLSSYTLSVVKSTCNFMIDSHDNTG